MTCPALGLHSLQLSHPSDTRPHCENTPWFNSGLAKPGHVSSTETPGAEPASDAGLAAHESTCKPSGCSGGRAHHHQPGLSGDKKQQLGAWGRAARPPRSTQGQGRDGQQAMRPPVSSRGSELVLGEPAFPLHPGIGPHGVLEHEVPEHLHPRVVLRQVVVVLGCDLPHLQGGLGSGLPQCLLSPTGVLLTPPRPATWNPQGEAQCPSPGTHTRARIQEAGLTHWGPEVSGMARPAPCVLPTSRSPAHSSAQHPMPSPPAMLLALAPCLLT